MAELRSRGGCSTCRKRRRKCDEARPACSVCTKRNLPCEYGVQVRWAAAKGSSAPNKRAAARVQRQSRPLVENATHSVETLTEFEERATPTGEDENENGNRNENGNVEGYERGNTVVSETTSWDYDLDVGIQLDPSLFASPGEHIAFVYYIKYLSGVLPAFDSQDNPYRRLSSLALASPVLLHTIISLSTEYLFIHGQAPADVTLQRHDQAIKSLREALNTASHPKPCTTFGDEISSKQATLAAVLMQVANVVFTGGSGVEAHLACAMHFMRDLGYIHQRIDGFLPRLLVQRFVMLDVVTSIQRFRRPQLKSDFWFLSPDDQYDRTQPSFREMTGCPQPVLCFFVRISILAADLREDVVDEFEVLTKASTLETDMRIYARSKVTTSTNRPPKASHLDALSQCFYWSAHLLLQRRVYRDATSSLRVQKTVADIVGLIKSMPVGCGPDSSLAFPFYLSSKEAITSEHRDWARQRNEEMKKVYPGRSRDAIMSLLHAMWEAVDIVREREPRMNATIDEILFELESDRELCLF